MNVLNWYKDNPILKANSTRYKYAKRLDIYAEEAWNYTDLLEICTQHQIFNLVIVLRKPF